MRNAICILVILAAIPCRARTITIDDNAPADFNNIQAAIDDANDGDTVLVADGTYTGEGNRDIDFKGKAITLRSEDGPENCIIDCEGRQEDPHRGFYFHTGEDVNSILNGFTIMNGGAPGDVGGGIYCHNASPTILDNIITANGAGQGGGIYCDNASPMIIRNTITSNTGYDSGAGIECRNSSATIMNNIIAENNVGGIVCRVSSPTIVNNTIVLNKGNYPYGGSSPGAGIYSYTSSPRITNCIFWGNACEFNYEVYQNYSGTLTIGYTCVQGGQAAVYAYSGAIVEGEGNIDADPLFADPTASDYHLKSQGARYDPNSATWVIDEVTSPCIDAGDPMSPIGSEPFPNGGRINMGAYGGTAEASKSYFGEPPCETIMAGDVNGDCEINFEDLRLMALHWRENRQE